MKLGLRLAGERGEAVHRGGGAVGGEGEVVSFQVNYRAMPQGFIWHSREEGKSCYIAHISLFLA